jgi:hypothetical protein
LGGKREENTDHAIGTKISQKNPKIASEIDILCFCPSGKTQKASSPLFNLRENARGRSAATHYLGHTITL